MRPYPGQWRSAVLVVAALFTGGGNVVGQRSAHLVNSFYKDANGTGRVYINPAVSPTTLVWKMTSGSAHGIPVTTNLPFDVAGSPLWIGGRRFLVPGFESATGIASIVMVRLEESSLQIVVEQTQSYGNQIDPYLLFWNDQEQNLYMYDFSASEVLVSPFAGVTLPAAGAFSSTNASASIPPLQNGGNYLLELFAARGSAEGVAVAEHLPSSASSYYHVKPDGMGGWQVVLGSTANPNLKPTIAVENFGRVNAMGPIRVTGVTGQVSLDEITFFGQTLTQTNIASPSGYSPLTLPQGGLLPGLYYRIHGGSGAAFNAYTSMVLLRYGAPQTVAQVTMPTGQIGTGLWVGNDDFAIVGRVSAGSSQAVPVPLDVYLWLGARNADGTDPVWQHPVSGVWYLTDVLAIAGPFHVDITSKVSAESLAFSLPIADEPGLQGGVLLMQWATVTPNQEAAVSDVLGAMITPPWPGSGTDAGSGQKREAAVEPSWLAAAKSMLPRVPEKSVVAIREWLASRPSLSPRGAGLAVWQSIVRKE